LPELRIKVKPRGGGSCDRKREATRGIQKKGVKKKKIKGQLPIAFLEQNQTRSWGRRVDVTGKGGKI